MIPVFVERPQERHVERVELTGCAGYDALPETLRCDYSLQEYLWLSDHEKATLQQRETEPE